MKHYYDELLGIDFEIEEEDEDNQHNVKLVVVEE